MTTNQPGLTDANIRQALLELAVGPDADALVQDVLRAVDQAPQASTRTVLGWPVRRVVLVAATILLLATVAGTAILSGGPEPTPEPTPTPTAYRIRQVRDFVLPFTYSLPEDVPVGLLAGPGRTELVRLGRETQGVDFLFVTFVHRCPGDSPSTIPDPWPENGGWSPEPEELLEGLREAGVGITELHETTLGGHSALATDIDPSAATCTGAAFHTDGLGLTATEVEQELDGPGRLIVARVDDATVVVHIWGTEEGYASWLPIATDFVESIEFIEPAP
jgi:hypothetical protein